jgi:hypothetical protein
MRLVIIHIPHVTLCLSHDENSWCLFLVDRCAATALHWTAGFDVNRITVPLPRAWQEYESVCISYECIDSC